MSVESRIEELERRALEEDGEPFEVVDFGDGPIRVPAGTSELIVKVYGNEEARR